MGVYFDFDDVDSFTVGAVGRPGQRTFLLQARRGRERVTVKCEKQQAAAIADYLRKVLNDLPPAEDRPMPSSLELAAPLDVAFVLGPVGLGYERANDRVLVQLDEIVPVDEDGELDPEALEDRSRVRVLLTRGQVEAFCEQADQLIAAGRPPCRWCSLPIDPDGHICPRMN
ncbi:MAG: hypothetical protein RLZZ362_151 [Actinomycetota bacterium]|jgi:uncharacterized repeat protein (TIGR03847 family)